MEEHDEGRGKNSASSGIASTSGSETEKKDMPTVILVIGRELSQSALGIIMPEVLRRLNAQFASNDESDVSRMSYRHGWIWQDNPNAADGCSSACIRTACIRFESGPSSHQCAICGQYRHQRYSEQSQGHAA